jgi:hypothetical protein
MVHRDRLATALGYHKGYLSSIPGGACMIHAGSCGSEADIFSEYVGSSMAIKGIQVIQFCLHHSSINT